MALTRANSGFSWKGGSADRSSLSGRSEEVHPFLTFSRHDLCSGLCGVWEGLGREAGGKGRSVGITTPRVDVDLMSGVESGVGWGWVGCDEEEVEQSRVANGWTTETTYLCDAKSDHFRPVLLWELVGAVGAGVRLVVVLASVDGGCRAGRRNHSVKRGGSQSQGGDKTTPQANVPNRNPAFELRAKRLETDIRMALSR